MGDLSCFLDLDLLLTGESGLILLGLSKLGNDVLMALSFHLKVFIFTTDGFEQFPYRGRILTVFLELRCPRDSNNTMLKLGTDAI